MNNTIPQSTSFILRQHETAILDLMLRHRESDHFAWFSLSDQYIRASITLLKALSGSGNETLSHQVMPCLFCLRHGIELFNKAVLILKDQDVKLIHDLQTLDNHTSKAIDALCSKSNINKLNKYFMSKKVGTNEQQLLDVHKTAISEYRRVVKKYVVGLPLYHQMTLQDIVISDKGGDLFRYPESQNIDLNLKFLYVSKVKKGSIENELQDAVILNDAIKTIYFALVICNKPGAQIMSVE